MDDIKKLFLKKSLLTKKIYNILNFLSKLIFNKILLLKIAIQLKLNSFSTFLYNVRYFLAFLIENIYSIASSNLIEISFNFSFIYLIQILIFEH